MVWEGASLWIFSAAPGEQYPRTDLHAHHVIQLTLALTGKVELAGGPGTASGVALAVAPDVPHTFQGTGFVAHLFVDPDGQAGRAIVKKLFAKAPIAPIPRALLGDLPERLRSAYEARGRTDDEIRAAAKAIIARVAGEDPRGVRVDPRITKLITWVGARLDQAVSLGDVAAVIGLSEGRTRHLFVEQTGLSFRTYLLWLRLVRAVELFAAGSSLTEAAHGAGFADSAHLSRTFRRMFGIAAASLRVS